MRKVLIIYPHFPPSNLAGVHRPRLFAQHLSLFGWEPVILTVDEKYYEEAPDYNLEKLLPATLRIEKVKAFPVTKPRLIGDIGLRGFMQLYKKAKQLIKNEKIDFVYIPIPSFYVALIGRLLHMSTGVKYGIDYIDPWVHHFPGSDKIFSRHWISSGIAKLLEPIAVRKASLITGVAAGYYQGVTDRNQYLLKQAVLGSMPYGGESNDHERLHELNVQPYLFSKDSNKIRLVYAGAMLPKAYAPLEAIFRAIKNEPRDFENVEIIFIGSGKQPNDPLSYNIKPLALQYGLWEKVIFEYPQRIPYLDVLAHLHAAEGVFVLGSTEPHYTPSKVYQGVLSEKPILAILHAKSSAREVIERSGAGIVLAFNGEQDISKVSDTFPDIFRKYLTYVKSFSPSSINKEMFDQYSARNVTSQLADMMNQALMK